MYKIAKNNQLFSLILNKNIDSFWHELLQPYDYTVKLLTGSDTQNQHFC